MEFVFANEATYLWLIAVFVAYGVGEFAGRWHQAHRKNGILALESKLDEYREATVELSNAYDVLWNEYNSVICPYGCKGESHLGRACI